MSDLYKNKEWLVNQYVDRGKKLVEIADICGVHEVTIRYWRDKFSIPPRSRKAAQRLNSDPRLKDRAWLYDKNDYAFVKCGDNTGRNLNADHIVPFAYILKKNNIETVNEALNCSDLWELSNGRTLCETCHQKTTTYGVKAAEYDESP